MATVYNDWGREIFHHFEYTATHVPPIDLQQKWFCVLSRLQANPIIENAPVAAIASVPSHILALRF